MHGKSELHGESGMNGESSLNGISLVPHSMLQPQTVQGFELLAEWDKTDFALLRIKERIPDHYNAYLAGFDASDQQPERGFTGIHHPMGDFKKISTYSGRVTKAAWIDEPAFLVHWQVDAWNRGTTERGSSGSPLFNQQGLVIGHLRGGFSSCESPLGSDYYGGVAWDWSGDDTLVHSLHRFLDPEGLGVKTLSGMRLNAARFRSKLNNNNNIEVNKHEVNNQVIKPKINTHPNHATNTHAITTQTINTQTLTTQPTVMVKLPEVENLFAFA
jgi:hypothetical protein